MDLNAFVYLINAFSSDNETTVMYPKNDYDSRISNSISIRLILFAHALVGYYARHVNYTNYLQPSCVVHQFVNQSVPIFRAVQIYTTG